MVFNKIRIYIETLDLSSISEERKALLRSLIHQLQLRINKGEVINLNFICTHNSRRSHLAQVWGQVMAHYYNTINIQCYSGGTVATAIFPMVVKTLENIGFEFQMLAGGNNPIYAIKYAPNQAPIIGFSKSFDDGFNPKSKFIGVMTCSEADEACPIIVGADKRIPLTYEDPKLFDGTLEQEFKYLERSTQIATELRYVFSELKT